MSEQIKPDAINTSDVLENKVEQPTEPKAEKVDIAEVVGSVGAEVVNFADKAVEELVEIFRDLSDSVDSMKRSKEAESIKSAFYKKINKDKIEDAIEEVMSPIEETFKTLYNAYKEKRGEYNKQLEQEKEGNLVAKKAVLEDLKALVEKQEDVNATFPAFREIQSRWKEIGPVPASGFRDLNDTYQFYVEKFYDMVKINRDLRDLDFKKNLEAKEGLCEAAEKLSESDNVVESFKELQKLHEQWKEYGPVDKEHREEIWNRFKAATSVINKKYQAYFEGLKDQQADNLAAKQVLCEKVEAIAQKEVTSSNEWNALSKEIENIQKEWKTIGFASKKENQKIYDRFRAACDKFYERKREFYSQYKDNMNDNLAKKLAIIETAESLKNSTEWKKATDQFINLQKQWKEIGAVPRKRSEQLWKRFRAACDEFFNERDKHAKPENDFYSNLKAKKKLVEEINAYVASDDNAENQAAMAQFSQKWQEIGFVPFKEKDNITKAYKDAMQAKFPAFGSRVQRSSSHGAAPKAPKSEKDILIQKYNALQQDIVTYENNIGFFAMSKNSEPLIKQMQKKIEDAKNDLKELEEKIRTIESANKAEEQE